MFSPGTRTLPYIALDEMDGFVFQPKSMFFFLQETTVFILILGHPYFLQDPLKICITRFYCHLICLRTAGWVVNRGDTDGLSQFLG